MTLALYGKSKKRQGSLLLAALLAILVASVGGLAIISSAFAHNANHSASATCDGTTWASRLWYENGGSSDPGDLRLVLIRDVKVNNVDYDPAWASGVGDGTNDAKQTNGAIVTRASYAGSQTGLPSAGGHTDFIWVGVDSTFDIFNRNQSSAVAAALNSNASAWAGDAEVYAWNGTSWVNQNFTSTVMQPSQADCKKIIVRKVTVGDPGATSFSADIDNTGGTAGDQSNKAFSVATQYSETFSGGADTDDFTVSEDTPPANWALTGKKVLSGDQTCPAAGGSWDAAGVASGGALSNLGGGETVTVCFRNTYTPPAQAKIIIKKVVSGPGSSASDNFTASVNNVNDSTGDAAGPLNFSQNTPYVHTFTADHTTDDFDVTETNANTNGYTVVGYSTAAGDVACPVAPESGTAGWLTAHPSQAFADALNDVANGDVVTVCFWNKKVPASVVNVAKTHDPAGPFGPGGTFKWKLAVTVTGSATTAITNITDTIPSPLTAEVYTSYSVTAGITCSNGDANNATVTCSLASGSAVGTYNIEIDITVPGSPTQDQCKQYTNTVTITGTNVPTTPGGPANTQTASDNVTVTCNPGTPEFSKSDGSVDNPNIYWTITIKNNNQFTSTYYVYDENAVLDSSDGCSPAASESPNDFFVCTLGAGVTGHLYIHTTYPGHANTCQPLDVTNTAYLVTSNTLTAQQAKDPANQLSSDGGTYHENASSAGCITWKKTGQWFSDVTGTHINWYIDITNTAAVAGSITINDPGTTLVTASCTNVVSATSPYTCDVPANGGVQLIVRGPEITGVNLVCDNYTGNNTAVNANNSQDSQTAQVTHTATPDKSCITVKKEKSDTSQPPTWKISITNIGDSSQGLYIQDSDAFLDSIQGGGSCTPGDTILGNGLLCTVDANSTLVLVVHKEVPPKTCQGTDVSNTAKVWVGTFPAPPTGEPDFTADGGTFTNSGADPSLCNRNVQVCKIVVGNGDGTVVGPFSYGFDIRPTGLGNVSGSNSATEANPDTDNTNGTEVCTTKQVPIDKTFDVVEWGSRPAGWMGDASGYPRYEINGGGQFSNNTTTQIAAGSSDVKVTFYNKELPKTKLIQVTKFYQNANGSDLTGYAPTAADRPTITLTPNPWTGVDTYDIVDDANCDLTDNGTSFYWTCTVPATYNPSDVSETPATGWTETFNGHCQLEVVKVDQLVRDLLDIVVEAQKVGSFCNTPYGRIIVIKDDQINGATGPLWGFTVSGGVSDTLTADTGTSIDKKEPLSATPITVTEDLFRSITQCEGSQSYYTLVDAPADNVLDTPGEVISWTFHNIPCGVLGTGGLIIEKYLDLNGDGDANDPGEGPLNSWTFTTTGSGGAITPGQQVKVTSGIGQILDYLSGFDPGTVLTTTESQQAGYVLTNVTLDGSTLGTNLTNNATILSGQTRVIRYYNQPLSSINVHKEAFTSHNGGPNVSAPNDDDGWTINLDSVNCNIHLVAVTDSNGNASFNNLPICNDYVVKENLNNPSSPGFVPISPATISGQTPTGQTLTFANRLVTTDPPCLNGCVITTPTPTPTTPPNTPTPTNTPVVTNTPTNPTNTPTATPTTPVTNIAGEKTPGPGGPTPIAPSTGGGVLGGTTGGFNLILILGGLLALTSGLSFVALGRKRR